MPNAEKIAAVARLKTLFQESDSYFVTDYQGLNVADMTILRKNFRENNVKYLIAKNTLLKLAAHEASLDHLDEHLLGPTAIAFCTEDAAVAARIIQDSFKANKLPRTKVFTVDGNHFDGAELGRLADLPPKEIIMSQLVAAVESPFSALVGTLDGFFRDLVGSIDALEEQRKGQE